MIGFCAVITVAVAMPETRPLSSATLDANTVVEDSSVNPFGFFEARPHWLLAGKKNADDDLDSLWTVA